MKVMALRLDQKEQIEEFKDYCRRYRGEIDESFLREEQLMKFEPNDENPTYIVMNDGGEIKAAASLIINEYSRRGKKARFRIFHSEIEDINCYKMLLEAMLNHTEGLEKIFIFIPLENKGLMDAFTGLNFNVERYTFLLVREDLEVPSYTLPEGYEIKDFRPNQDEEAYALVRNAGFANLKGSETPITPEMVRKSVASKDYIEGGIKLLYHQDRPIGVVRGADDDFRDAPIMNIGPLAILPEYQGKGLGRSLLRASLGFAKEKSYKRTILCVNAENDRAKALYIQEGFQQVEAVACYKYDLVKG